MPDRYTDDRSVAQRIADRLKNSGDDKSWPATHTVETQPTRTFTNIHRAAQQQNATRSGQPKGSSPQSVGVGETFLGGMSEDAFNKTYGTTVADAVAIRIKEAVMDELKALVRALIDAERAEARAKHRAFGLDASDRAAFSNIHRAQTGDKVILPTAPAAKTADEIAKAGGWVDPLPLKTPYVDHVDRIAEAFARREKEAALRERIKELTEEHERLLAVVRNKGTTK
jgi:hypothetical protein